MSVLSWKQGFLVGFDPPVDSQSRLSQASFLGSWGGGKTYPAVYRALIHGIRTPHDPRLYGRIKGKIGSAENTPPVTLVTAVTGTDAMATVGALMKQILREMSPDYDLVARVRSGNQPELYLRNGHCYRFASAAGSNEGPSVSAILIDEIADPIYVRTHSNNGKRVLDNLLGRVRDPKAKRWCVTFAGLAVCGHAEEYCRVYREATPEDWDDVREAHRPATSRPTGQLWRDGRKAYALLGPEDNPVLRNTDYGASVSAAAMKTGPDGWLEVAGASFADFSLRRHVQLPPGFAGLTRAAVQSGRVGDIVLGYDAIGQSQTRDRRAGASLVVVLPFVSPAHGPSALVVDELHSQQAMGSQHFFEQFKSRGCGKGPYRGRVSMICVDPTLSPDTILAIRRVYPDARVVQMATGPYRKETTGVEAIQTALLTHSGVTRLFFAPWLAEARSERQLISAMPAYQLGARNAIAHGVDALRYAVQVLIPLVDRPTDQVAVGGTRDDRKNLRRSME